MNYVKKMCILRQVRQGFSGDGKTLSGLIKIEQYGKNLSVEVSIINFAPLVSGEYYCLLSDGKGKTEMLSLRGKSLFNILSDLDISRGFCGVICYVKNEVVPIAYGINGNGSYDWRNILNSALPPVFPTHAKTQTEIEREPAETEIAETITETITEKTIGVETTSSEKVPAEKVSAKPQTQPPAYDDETVATENYYREKEENGQELFQKISDDAHLKSATENQAKKAGIDATANVDVDGARHAFETDGEGYFRAVKAEIDELFAKYPRDDTLNGAFACSEWVRVKEGDAPEYLVGVVFDDGTAKYICYALATEDRENPPEEIRAVCSFVPLSPYQTEKGYFVIFQSATTGECIQPNKI